MYRNYVRPQCEVIELGAERNLMAASGGDAAKGNIPMGGSVDKGGDLTGSRRSSVWNEEP